MKAVVWHGKRDVRVDEVPDPTIEEPTDAIIRVTSSGICGSDLHLYEVMGPFMQEGDVLGHEPMGIVEETGAGGTHVQPGDGVVIRSTSRAGTASCAPTGCNRSARLRRFASTAPAPRCWATPSSTGTFRAGRPSSCGCPRPTTARSRSPTDRPTTASSS